MKVEIVTGAVAKIEADAVVPGIFEGTEKLEGAIAELDTALGGVVAQLVAGGEIKGKCNERTVIHSLGRIPAAKAVVLGLGKKNEYTTDIVRGAAAEVCRDLKRKNVKSAAIALPADVTLENTEVVQAITEGALLGTYSFRRHLTAEAEHGEIERLSITVAEDADVADLDRARERGETIAEAVKHARDMVNEPANYMTPTDMAEMSMKIAGETGLEIDVLEREQMEELGMGALLGVARGSVQPPKLIVLRYKGGDTDEIGFALIGKAITFDSGGISIKPSAGMEEMKDDMSGGAAVIAAMGAIARLKPAMNVVGIVPATENLPGGSALKPGDVLVAMGGKTIEIISTDAEGRLALADAIGYARKLGVQRIVDIATLTGAMVVALGKICTGAFTNNQPLVDRVIAAGDRAGERIWQMPMYDDYKEMNKSDVADIKNVGGRDAGSITAAQFLGAFVEDVPWVHLDIAGTAWTDKEKNYLTKGATGIPVRTLINLVLSTD